MLKTVIFAQIEIFDMQTKTTKIWYWQYLSIWFVVENFIKWEIKCLIFIKFFFVLCVVGLVFRAQAQQVGDSGPKNLIQWICRERVTELGLNEVNVN